MTINGVLLGQTGNVANTTLSNLTIPSEETDRKNVLRKLRGIGMVGFQDLSEFYAKKKNVYEVYPKIIGLYLGELTNLTLDDATFLNNPVAAYELEQLQIPSNISATTFSLKSGESAKKAYNTGYDYIDDIDNNYIVQINNNWYSFQDSTDDDTVYVVRPVVLGEIKGDITQVILSDVTQDSSDDNNFYTKVTTGSYVISGEGSKSPTFSYTVEKASGASYGFTLNDSTGYYTSDNKNIKNSAAVAKVTLTITGSPMNVIISYICYGEINHNYGLISTLNNTLGTTYSEDTTNVAKTMKSESSSLEEIFVFSNVPVGTSTFYIKYRKDSTTHSNDDTLQFKCSATNTIVAPVKTNKRIYTPSSSFSGGVSTSLKSGTVIPELGIYYIPELDVCFYDNSNYMCGGDGILFNLYGGDTEYGQTELICIKIGGI